MIRFILMKICSHSKNILIAYILTASFKTSDFYDVLKMYLYNGEMKVREIYQYLLAGVKLYVIRK